jgi:serine/threonine protein kinase
MSELPLPAQVGPYELLLRLGSGAMASVYLARLSGEEGFARSYAVKLIHPWMAEIRELVDMLMDEGRIAARLSHPNVVATLDLGRDGPTYYLAMEYVDGVSLDRLLEPYPEWRPPELIVPIAIDALRGLQAAHELCDSEGKPLELVHRDISPGNVLVTVDGNALIADFGVAKARARVTKTNPGVVKGKAGYVAPEVVLGRAIDGRADVFSMGVLVWNALTGTKLFDTENLASSVTALMRSDVPPPSTVGLCPPAIFDQPILTALRREPGERHPSAFDFAEALSDALDMAGGRAEPSRIGAWVKHTFGPELDRLRELTAPDLGPPPEIANDGREEPTRSMRRVGKPEPTPEPGPVAIAYQARGPAAPEPAPAPKKKSLWPIVIGALVLLLSLITGAAVAWLVLGGHLPALDVLLSSALLSPGAQ